MRNEFTAVYEQDGDWVVAYCPEVPGANEGKESMPQPAPEPTPEELLLTAIFGKSPKSEGAGQLVHFAHVEMAAEPTLGEVIDFLNDFRGAYGAVDSFLSASVPNTYDPSVRLAERWFQESLSPPRDLVLYRAGFESPGFWELPGNLNPLKVICDYL
jgi:hypothetical protein